MLGRMPSPFSVFAVTYGAAGLAQSQVPGGRVFVRLVDVKSMYRRTDKSGLRVRTARRP